MKRRIMAGFLALFLLLPISVKAAGTIAEPYINDQVLVGYEDGRFELLQFENDAQLIRALEGLAADPAVTLVQPNYTYTGTALSVNDSLAASQWALHNDGTFQIREDDRMPVRENPFLPDRWSMWPFAGTNSGQTVEAVAGIDIGMEEALAQWNGGNRETVVALIDTGVDADHQELQGVLWVNEDEIPGNGIDDDRNGYVDDVNGWNFYHNNAVIYSGADTDSHGTHGAGTIAAVRDNETGIAGIAHGGVKIMVLKALGGRDGSGSTASILQAIRYAQDNGAVICNLSLGSNVSDRAMYRVMAQSDMLFVAAAGNDGANTDRQACYPASYDLDNIISVANLQYNGTLHQSSNYGAGSVDLAAPGTYILSTTPENGYGYMTGTSMAAPMVTAAAAMIYAQYADITPLGVKALLLDTASPLAQLEGKVLTGGMLDLGAAMTADAQAYMTPADEPQTAGIAPEIRLQLRAEWGRTLLYVAVADADGDLDLTAYRQGTYTAEDFPQEEAETFACQKDGTAVFQVTGVGAITFYAKDKAGNETVAVVELSAQADHGHRVGHGPGHRGGMGGYMPGYAWFDSWFDPWFDNWFAYGAMKR